MQDTVFRIVRRRARPGCGEAYEAVVRGMFVEASGFPGYLAAELIPPPEPGGEYQIVQRFASAADLARWNASPQRAAWLQRLQPLADGDPEYRLLGGLEAWFAPVAVATAAGQPTPRWRMTVVSWMGIFPTVAAVLHFVAPLLAWLPFLLRTALLTALVAVLMAYLVMPRMTRWMAWWLRPPS